MPVSSADEDHMIPICSIDITFANYQRHAGEKINQENHGQNPIDRNEQGPLEDNQDSSYKFTIGVKGQG